MCYMYVIVMAAQERMHSTLRQKDTYIDKLENERETQNREMAYLYATNSDLVDQNKVCVTYDFIFLHLNCVL